MPSEVFLPNVPASQSHLIPVGRLLPSIRGLCGIATLAILLYHLVHLAKMAVPESFHFIGGDFGKGVHLFFVVSAFSLMYSTESTMHRQDWISEYFLKRFFRVTLLLYFILAAMILWPKIKSHVLADSLESIMLNVTFMFGFALWSGIARAGWSIGFDMLFYAVFPVLLLSICSISAMVGLVIISITYAARSSFHMYYQDQVADYGYN